MHNRFGLTQGFVATSSLFSAMLALSTPQALAAPSMVDANETSAVGSSAEEQQSSGQAIVVTGKTFKADALSSSKRTLPVLDTPQSVSILSEDLLDQQARVTLLDAFRNVTGISIQAGEGNPPAGDSLKIRGFEARENIQIDGVRDLGNYFRDLFEVESVEVTKGPSSAFEGRGNVGGTVNLVTKTPKLANKTTAELQVGTSEHFRAVLDANLVLSADNGIALRFNAFGFSADVAGRDFVKNERFGFAPSIAFGLDRSTRFTLSYLYQQQDNLPDAGLPNARNRSLERSSFAGRVAPVDPDNFYGYSTDFQDVIVNRVTGVFEQDFGETISLRSLSRYAHTDLESIVSSPRFTPGNLTTIDANTRVLANQKFRDQVDEIFINQTDLNVTFNTGSLKHTLVIGFEIAREKTQNNRTLDVDGPATNLFNPVLQAAPPALPNGTIARIDQDSEALFLFNTIEFSPQFLLTGGVRFDSVKTRAQGIDTTGRFPGFVTDLTRTDDEFSGSVGLIYKPVKNVSVYAGFGTGFETSGRATIVQVAGANNNPPITPGAFNVAPERSRAFELGVKADVLDERLNLAAALFQTNKTSARTPGGPGEPPTVLDGEQRVRGFEISAAGNITPELNIFAGYTYLDGEVTRSNIDFERGLRLDNLPKHSFNLFAAFQATDAFALGGGVQYISSRISNLGSMASATASMPGVGNIPITVPGYTTFDAFVEYKVSEAIELRLNVINLTDKRFFQSFTSGQSIPAAGATGILSLKVSF
jgi:catecholate siderophore receptor